jgi:hypothetical protein
MKPREDARAQFATWFNEDHKAQNLWCVDYMKKNSDLHSSLVRLDGSVKKVFDEVVRRGEDKALLLLIKLKVAWSKQKSRDNRSGYKPYSFEMRKSVQGKLKALAKARNCPINAALEAIIDDNDKYKKDLEEVWEKKLGNQKQKHDKHFNTLKDILNAKLFNQKVDCERQEIINLAMKNELQNGLFELNKLKLLFRKSMSPESENLSEGEINTVIQETENDMKSIR